MDKCREAFEAKYKDLNPDDKCTLMANGNYSGWVKQSHWKAWQSRQAELDQAYADIETFAQAHQRECEFKAQFAKEVDFLKAQIGIKRDQIKSFESEIKKSWQAVEEKDKRIKVALERLGLAIEAEKDWAIIEAIKALRGEHE